ncbi:MAG: branched-chain amino acid ABC transporter substrate-binding protein [Actinobacteria bacterium]|nr:branched-chain amino acid ABC transporter substrate-binding protein [Actinomycetota bacterium]
MGIGPARIGFAAPLSGDQAIVGVPMRDVLDFAIKEANSRGTLPYRLELVAADDGADEAKAAAVAQGLVADESVVAMVGHKNSGPSLAAAPFYQAAGMTQILASSTTAALTSRGYTNLFRVCASDALQGAAVARFAVSDLVVARIAVVNDGTAYGTSLAETFRLTAESCGARTVMSAGVTPGDSDFSPVVRQMAEVKPDAVYFGLTEIEASRLAPQMRRAGVDVVILGADGSRRSKFVELAGDAAEGAYMTYAGVDPESLQGGLWFTREFERRYGQCPVYGPEIYDAAYIIIEALRRAGTPDRGRVLAEVRAMKRFPGVTGPISFDERGEREDVAVSLWRVEGGQNRFLRYIS